MYHDYIATIFAYNINAASCHTTQMGINKGLSYRFLKGKKENHRSVILIHCFKVLEKTASEVSGLIAALRI